MNWSIGSNLYFKDNSSDHDISIKLTKVLSFYSTSNNESMGTLLETSTTTTKNVYLMLAITILCLIC